MVGRPGCNMTCPGFKTWSGCNMGWPGLKTMHYIEPDPGGPLWLSIVFVLSTVFKRKTFLKLLQSHVIEEGDMCC